MVQSYSLCIDDLSRRRGQPRGIICWPTAAGGALQLRCPWRSRGLRSDQNPGKCRNLLASQRQDAIALRSIFATKFEAHRSGHRVWGGRNAARWLLALDLHEILVDLYTVDVVEKERDEVCIRLAMPTFCIGRPHDDVGSKNCKVHSRHACASVHASTTHARAHSECTARSPIQMRLQFVRERQISKALGPLAATIHRRSVRADQWH